MNLKTKLSTTRRFDTSSAYELLTQVNEYFDQLNCFILFQDMHKILVTTYNRLDLILTNRD